MRTTVTIDDPIIAQLKQTAAKTGKSFNLVVNETLQAGLNQHPGDPAKPYRLTPTSLGQPRPGIDLGKALDLADQLEDQAIADELEHGW